MKKLLLSVFALLPICAVAGDLPTASPNIPPLSTSSSRPAVPVPFATPRIYGSSPNIVDRSNVWYAGHSHSSQGVEVVPTLLLAAERDIDTVGAVASAAVSRDDVAEPKAYQATTLEQPCGCCCKCDTEVHVQKPVADWFLHCMIIVVCVLCLVAVFRSRRA